jgi:hypothetical protein
MKQKDRNRLIRVAAGVCGLCLFGSAIASPPFSRGRSSLSPIDSARSISVASRLGARQEYAPTTHLDLRPPGDSPPANIHGGAAALASAPFPSAIHHLDLGKADLGSDDRVQPPALGTGELNFRVMSQAEIFAHRIHREGLPVARLWESKSALLSIGLNQRGKPGLWLTQKIH